MPLEVASVDDLPPALAAKVREKLGEPALRPAHAHAVKSTSSVPAPKRNPSPDAPPKPIPLAVARRLAEEAGTEALRRAVPLAGVAWSSRCDKIRPRMMKGLLGRAATWVYEAEGRVHAGWLFSGSTHRWHVLLDMATGAVMGAEIKTGRR